MAVSSTYYLNAPSLGSATSVFSDSGLTTLATDGFYSDGIISREQVSGVLLPQQTCPSCVSYNCVSGTCTDPGDGTGTYATLVACEAACFPVSYNCVSGTCTDPGDGTGTYPTLVACEAACFPVSYNCVSGTCTDPGDGSGTYATLVACEAACFPVSYNCVSGTCTDPGDGSGTYATLVACEAVCGVTPCGSTINASGGQGIYLLDLDTGSTVLDVGAVIVRFNPFNVPDGIRATLGANVYNKLTSLVDGLHQSSVPGNFTYVGEIASDCGISGTTYPALIEYLYDGTSFVVTGNTQSVTVNPGDVSLGSLPPGSCLMVIPKLVASPSIINFEVVGPCSGTAWEMSVDCPILLTGFSSSVVAVSSVAVCELTETVTYYNASLPNTPGIVGLYDFVYSDAYGSTPLAAGFYLASGSIIYGDDWFEVDSNGVVIDLGVCTPPPPVSYNCVLGTCTDPGDGTGTYATLVACQAACGPPVYAYSVRLTNVLGTICTDPIATVWSTSLILTTGDTIYYDSALTTLVTGFNYVVDDAYAPDIYNLDPATGIIGADTTLNCP